MMNRSARMVMLAREKIEKEKLEKKDFLTTNINRIGTALTSVENVKAQETKSNLISMAQNYNPEVIPFKPQKKRKFDSMPVPVPEQNLPLTSREKVRRWLTFDVSHVQHTAVNTENEVINLIPMGFHEATNNEKVNNMDGTTVADNQTNTGEIVVSGHDNMRTTDGITHNQTNTGETVVFSLDNAMDDTDVLLHTVDAEFNSPIRESTSIMVVTSEHLSDSVETQTRRKRKAKMRKAEKEQQKLQELLVKHNVLPPCKPTCKRSCTVKINEEQRNKINREFWNLSWFQRKLFIVSGCKRQTVGRHTANASRRSKTNLYFLTGTDGNVSVCKIFYLTTLGFNATNDSMVQLALRSVSEGSSLPTPDGRGKASNQHKIDRVIVRTHIESFNPCISHYRREHAPNRRYLPSDISVKKMHEDFIEKCPDHRCSYELYRNVVKKMNISFTKLGHEQCEICESFQFHNPNHKEENLNELCELCIKWKKHIDKAKASRQEYRRDRQLQTDSGKTNIYSADLQKIIMLPRMEEFKSVCFTRRIIAFNESFVPLGPNTRTIAAIWHEGIAGRKKEEITSTFHNFFLEKRDEEHVILWLDNCSGQNKNWAFFTFLIYMVNSDETATNIIEIKYFEPGHTFMSADNFHHQVELSLAEAGKVYDFSDYVTCMQNANSGKVLVKQMQPNNFSQWKDFSSTFKINKIDPRPYLCDMVYVRAERCEKGKRQNILWYRTEFSGTDIELNFLNTKAMKQGVAKPAVNSVERGVPQAKKDDIISKLCPLMPENRRKFWNELKTSYVEDLTTTE